MSIIAAIVFAAIAVKDGGALFKSREYGCFIIFCILFVLSLAAGVFKMFAGNLPCITDFYEYVIALIFPFVQN